MTADSEDYTVLCEMTWSGALAQKPQPKRLKPPLFLVSPNRVLREALAQIAGAKRRASIRVASYLSAHTMRNIMFSGTQILVLDAVALSFDSFERMREIRAAVPELKVVLINVGKNESAFRDLARLDVHGYLLHNPTVPEIVAALDGVMNGAIVCPLQFLRTLLQQTKISGAGGT
jgi:DNA-binding NarL/FixJ family response regulator